MNRREVLKGLAGVAALSTVASYAALTEKRWGPMNVHRHTDLKRQGIHIHVFHEGRDITTDCCFADDTGDGMAEVFVKDGNGRIRFTGTGTPRAGVAKKIVHGVTFRQGSPL